MTKIGRNDPCSCGSGKKYKKCCESKEAAARKLTAHKIEGEDLTQKVSSIAGLFQKISLVPPVRLPEAPVEPLKEVISEPQEEARKVDLEPPAQEPTEKS